jgi:hypothetical protein
MKKLLLAALMALSTAGCASYGAVYSAPRPSMPPPRVSAPVIRAAPPVRPVAPRVIVPPVCTVVVPVAPRPSLVHRWVLYWALLHHHQPQEDIRDVTPTEITQAPAVVVPVRPRSHWLTWAIIGVLGLVAFILWLRKALT